jgi:hemolysin activation/secretion protein
LTTGLRVLGFVDAGWMDSINVAATSTGKIATDQLASAGLGLRYGLGQASISLDWGSVFTGSSMPTSAASSSSLPKAGDEKLHVNLTARF